MLALVQRFGRNSTSFQALSPGMHHWFDDARGMVAYADTGRAWVSAGEPIASADNALASAAAFVDAARAAGRRVSFFATEGILASSPRFRRLQIGEQPAWDPRLWHEHLRTHRSLREQLRRARAKHVAIRAVDAQTFVHEPTLRAELLHVVHSWLASRSMAPMHFLVEVAPLSNIEHRRVFVAARDGRAVGLVSLVPVSARQGWFFEHLVRAPGAPNGTAELLVDHAMRVLASEQVSWATLGMAPLAGNVSTALRVIRGLSRPLFNFDGLAAFKRKLRPQHWEPIYLAYPAEDSGVVALLDGLRAFAGSSLWRFAMRSTLRALSRRTWPLQQA